MNENMLKIEVAEDFVVVKLDDKIIGAAGDDVVKRHIPGRHEQMAAVALLKAAKWFIAGGRLPQAACQIGGGA